jgi:hypothetical protein
MPLHPTRPRPRWAALVLVACALAAAGRSESPNPALPRSWTWVQGTVFVPTNSVNEAQQWDAYDPAVNERELHFASVYGINVVRVYLHYFIYLKKKAALLAEIEDFLGRADHYGIKTEFVFFDDCWNEPSWDILSADYRYPAPIPGVHNSRWLVSPGQDVLTHYDKHRESLKAYVQDIVSAHRADPRVVFWEIYNEPKNEDTTRRLERDAEQWIKETGTAIPATATGKEFSGGPFSDFPSWHEYRSYNLAGDGHTLCTECMNRQGQTVPGVVEHYKGKVGYIMWEFGIGRDNCRFAWENTREKPRPDEPTTPFHGIVYPDGHPWSINDVSALLGAEGFARGRFFITTYYKDGGFAHPAKTSVTPFIDLALGTEPGTGSPDATAGIPLTGYSIAYRGSVRAAASGPYTFSVESDGTVEVRIDGQPVVSQTSSTKESSGTVALVAGRTYPVDVRYKHASGPSRLSFSWSGPSFSRRLVEPESHAEGL